MVEFGIRSVTHIIARAHIACGHVPQDGQHAGAGEFGGVFGIHTQQPAHVVLGAAVRHVDAGLSLRLAGVLRQDRAQPRIRQATDGAGRDGQIAQQSQCPTHLDGAVLQQGRHLVGLTRGVFGLEQIVQGAFEHTAAGFADAVVGQRTAVGIAVVELVVGRELGLAAGLERHIARGLELNPVHKGLHRTREPVGGDRALMGQSRVNGEHLLAIGLQSACTLGRDGGGVQRLQLERTHIHRGGVDFGQQGAREVVEHQAATGARLGIAQAAHRGIDRAGVAGRHSHRATGHELLVLVGVADAGCGVRAQPVGRHQTGGPHFEQQGRCSFRASTGHQGAGQGIELQIGLGLQRDGILGRDGAVAQIGLHQIHSADPGLATTEFGQRQGVAAFLAPADHVAGVRGLLFVQAREDAGLHGSGRRDGLDLGLRRSACSQTTRQRQGRGVDIELNPAIELVPGALGFDVHPFIDLPR